MIVGAITNGVVCHNATTISAVLANAEGVVLCVVRSVVCNRCVRAMLASMAQRVLVVGSISGCLS